MQTDRQTSSHPSFEQVVTILRIAAWVSFVVQIGLAAVASVLLLLAIAGRSFNAVLLAKSVSQPQGVAIYDPSRSIRSVDVFVAAANTTGITAHFVGVVASLSVFNWLHRPTD